MHMQISGPDKQHRLRAALAIIGTCTRPMYQREFQGLWRQYQRLDKEGDLGDLRVFWEAFSEDRREGRPRVWPWLLTARAWLLQLRRYERSGDGDAPLDIRQRCWDLLGLLAGDQAGGDNDDDLPRSLSLKLLRADILLEVANLDDATGDDALISLAHTPPPSGSWSSVLPACEDYWLDPANELIDLESLLPWEEQVSSCRARLKGHCTGK